MPALVCSRAGDAGKAGPVTRGLRPVPPYTVAAHMFGVGYLLEGDYSLGYFATITFWMLVGILGHPARANRLPPTLGCAAAPPCSMAASQRRLPSPVDSHQHPIPRHEGGVVNRDQTRVVGDRGVSELELCPTRLCDVGGCAAPHERPVDVQREGD
jgi:hypothetical protein